MLTLYMLLLIHTVATRRENKNTERRTGVQFICSEINKIEIWKNLRATYI